MISIRDRRRTGVAVVAALMLTFLTLLHMPSAYAAQPKALINSDTVTGGASSAEANLATSLGFSVDVVDGPTWDAMTQPQFASYQVLIAGDPTCSTIASSFITNEATWAPVVMGTAVNTKEGNRVLVGTDPVLHSGGTGQRTTGDLRRNRLRGGPARAYRPLLRHQLRRQLLLSGGRRRVDDGPAQQRQRNLDRG